MANKTVVVIPGFGGSRLQLSYFGGAIVDEVWCNYARLLALGWEQMKLAADGTSPFYVGGLRLVAGPHIDFYYPQLCDRLRQAGYEPTSGASDWRMRLADSVRQTADLVVALSAAGPVSVVAHSRGGLVAIAVANLLRAEGKLSALRQVIALGAPYAGSYEPTGYLGGWADTIGWLSLALFARNGVVPALNALGDVRSNVTTWPGLYELLPNPEAAVLAGDEHIAQLYDPARWQESGVPVSAAHLTAARDRWATAPSPPTGLPWSSIVGRGYATSGAIVAGKFFAGPACLGRDYDGDGIVPVWSATPAFGHVYQVSVEHSALVSDGASLAVVIPLLAG